MTKKRVVETNEGIQSELTVEVFDRFARNMRDKGWNNVESILSAGITTGNVLEIGPGPGYVGLEWLKRAPSAHLTGCEISANMLKLAQQNAREYGLQDSASYVQGNCMEMPFEAETFDGVFSNGSLHEWEDPVRAFNEIHRVLKPGGRFCICDMRRDVSPIIKRMIYLKTEPKEIRPGFLTSLGAAYTAKELSALFQTSMLKNCSVREEFFGLCASGVKA